MSCLRSQSSINEDHGSLFHSCNLQDPDKAGTARRHLSSVIESLNTNVYSLEMSMLGYKPDKKGEKVIPYTEESCE